MSGENVRDGLRLSEKKFTYSFVDCSRFYPITLLVNVTAGWQREMKSRTKSKKLTFIHWGLPTQLGAF
jgi:hypothetical protein